MALILNIDTAVQTASVCLADNKKIVALLINPSDKESASWLHTAIQRVIQQSNCSFEELDAIAISEGPGSYTGLRVGMSAAKGLCYAWSKPLITVNTLQLMAAAADKSIAQLLCPMIDARRMEVFTALFDQNLHEVLPSHNLILDATSFGEWLEKYTINFFGNGSVKATSVVAHKNAAFTEVNSSSESMVGLSLQKFESAQFANLAYTEPFYGKDFHSSIPKKIY